MLQFTVPFDRSWLTELVAEGATLIFFVIVGYKFKPQANNPYLRLAVDDDVQMEEV